MKKKKKHQIKALGNKGQSILSSVERHTGKFVDWDTVYQASANPTNFTGIFHRFWQVILGRKSLGKVKVWIDPKGGSHYHKRDAQQACIDRPSYKLVNLEDVKKGKIKTMDGKFYHLCSVCYGHRKP